MKGYDDFFNEAQQYTEILKYYEENGEIFTDTNFGPSSQTKETEKGIDYNKYEWKRIDEFYTAPLFKKEAIKEDIIQKGKLEDNYFIASLLKIAKQPNLVEMLFDTRTKESETINLKCGAVIVYFYVFGKRTPVLIDTLIPFNRENGIPVFSHPSYLYYSPWFCLVEKAYAKLHNSYSAIIKGTLSQAFYHLFGYFPYHHTFDSILQKRQNEDQISNENDNEYLFSLLMKWQFENSVLGTDIKNDRLDTSQFFLITKARREEGKNFICLRRTCPASEKLPKDLKDSSSTFSSELKRKLGVHRRKNGTFWMTDSEFFSYFQTIDVAKPINPEYHVKNFITKFEQGENDGYEVNSSSAQIEKNQTFAFKLNDSNVPIIDDVKVDFLIEKRRPFIFKDDSESNYQVLIVYSSGKKVEFDQLSSYKSETFQSSEQLFSFTVHVTEKEPFIIVLQRNDKKEYSEDCYVKVCCKYEFDLYDVDCPDTLAEEEREDEKVGIVFNNQSKRYRNLSRKVTLKSINGKEVPAYESSDSREFDDSFYKNFDLIQDSEASTGFYEYDYDINDDFYLSVDEAQIQTDEKDESCSSKPFNDDKFSIQSEPLLDGFKENVLQLIEREISSFSNLNKEDTNGQKLTVEELQDSIEKINKISNDNNLTLEEKISPFFSSVRSLLISCIAQADSINGQDETVASHVDEETNASNDETNNFIQKLNVALEIDPNESNFDKILESISMLKNENESLQNQLVHKQSQENTKDDENEIVIEAREVILNEEEQESSKLQAEENEEHTSSHQLLEQNEDHVSSNHPSEKDEENSHLSGENEVHETNVQPIENNEDHVSDHNLSEQEENHDSVNHLSDKDEEQHTSNNLQEPENHSEDNNNNNESIKNVSDKNDDNEPSNHSEDKNDESIKNEDNVASNHSEDKNDDHDSIQIASDKNDNNEPSNHSEVKNDDHSYSIHASRHEEEEESISNKEENASSNRLSDHDEKHQSDNLNLDIEEQPQPILARRVVYVSNGKLALPEDADESCQDQMKTQNSVKDEQQSEGKDKEINEERKQQSDESKDSIKELNQRNNLVNDEFMILPTEVIEKSAKLNANKNESDDQKAKENDAKKDEEEASKPEKKNEKINDDYQDLLNSKKKWPFEDPPQHFNPVFFKSSQRRKKDGKQTSPNNEATDTKKSNIDDKTILNSSSINTSCSEIIDKNELSPKSSLYMSIFDGLEQLEEIEKEEKEKDKEKNKLKAQFLTPTQEQPQTPTQAQLQTPTQIQITFDDNSYDSASIQKSISPLEGLKEELSSPKVWRVTPSNNPQRPFVLTQEDRKSPPTKSPLSDYSKQHSSSTPDKKLSDHQQNENQEQNKNKLILSKRADVFETPKKSSKYSLKIQENQVVSYETKPVKKNEKQPQLQTKAAEVQTKAAEIKPEVQTKVNTAVNKQQKEVKQNKPTKSVHPTKSKKEAAETKKQNEIKGKEVKAKIEDKKEEPKKKVEIKGKEEVKKKPENKEKVKNEVKEDLKKKIETKEKDVKVKNENKPEKEAKKKNEIKEKEERRRPKKKEEENVKNIHKNQEQKQNQHIVQIDKSNACKNKPIPTKSDINSNMTKTNDTAPLQITTSPIKKRYAAPNEKNVNNNFNVNKDFNQQKPNKITNANPYYYNYENDDKMNMFNQRRNNQKRRIYDENDSEINEDDITTYKQKPKFKAAHHKKPFFKEEDSEIDFSVGNDNLDDRLVYENEYFNFRIGGNEFGMPNANFLNRYQNINNQSRKPRQTTFLKTFNLQKDQINCAYLPMRIKKP